MDSEEVKRPRRRRSCSQKQQKQRDRRPSRKRDLGFRSGSTNRQDSNGLEDLATQASSFKDRDLKLLNVSFAEAGQEQVIPTSGDRGTCVWWQCNRFDASVCLCNFMLQECFGFFLFCCPYSFFDFVPMSPSSKGH